MIASASAIAVPTFAGPLLAKIPGGVAGQAVAGAALIYVGVKASNGMVKAAAVGAGAGILAATALAFFATSKNRATA